MNMKTQEIGLLSSEELNAVVGGMMNDGRGQLDPKAPGALPGRGENGAPDNSKLNTAKLLGGLIILGGIVELGIGL
jgi:hypothetical protein